MAYAPPAGVFLPGPRYSSPHRDRSPTAPRAPYKDAARRGDAAAEQVARLDRDELGPGESVLAQIHLDRPLVAHREEEIRAFKPEPYWLVEAKFEASGERRYAGRYKGGKRPAEEQEASAHVGDGTGQPGALTLSNVAAHTFQLARDETAIPRYSVPAMLTVVVPT